MCFPGENGGEQKAAGQQEKRQQLEQSFAAERTEDPGPEEEEDGREEVYGEADREERVTGAAGEGVCKVGRGDGGEQLKMWKRRSNELNDD